LIEDVKVLIELLNELNEDVVTNEDVSIFNTEEVVANPKFVICADELTVPDGTPVFESAVILLSNELLAVVYDEVNVLNVEELKNGVTTGNEEVVAYPKLVI
jgi:hypothetical protein